MCYVADGSGKPPTTLVSARNCNKGRLNFELSPFSFVLPVSRGKIAELKHLSVCFELFNFFVWNWLLPL